MKAVTFLLHTQQPILATSLQGDPNSDVSYSYIPGSMIRGMLIGRYCQKNNLPELDNQDDQIRNLFFNGKTRYLNAYLFDPDQEQRTLPTPLSLYREKNQESSEYVDVYDFSQATQDYQLESPKRLNQNFCIVDEYGNISLYQEKRRINIHNRRDRKKGKGTDNGGAVFRYDAIDAEQVFQGVILSDIDEDAKIISSLLTPEKETDIINVWLGGSISAGYGHATVELLPDKDNWNEVQVDWEQRSQRNNNLTITLLSDTLIRDEWGQPTADPKILVQLLSEQLPSKQLIENGIYASSTIVGGFNRKWGLPLPQVPAIAAGSVFVFKLPTEQLDEERIRTLEIQGIGERRVDGFGRVVFNWLKEDGYFNASVSTAEKKQEAQKILKGKSETIAKKMAKEILIQKLDELLLEQVKSKTPKNFSKITNNQLSRIMIAARNSLTEIQKGLRENEEHSLNKLLGKNRESSQLTKTGKEQLQNSDFDDQLRNWLKNPEHWIQSAWSSKNSQFLDEQRQPTITIADQSVTLEKNIALEYTLRLIIAVIKKMMKDKNND